MLLSSLAAMFLLHLALKLGVASGRDLAQACRDAYPRWVGWVERAGGGGGRLPSRRAAGGARMGMMRVSSGCSREHPFAR